MENLMERMSNHLHLYLYLHLPLLLLLLLLLLRAARGGARR